MAREPLGGCLLIALALAGCGGSDKPEAPAAGKPQPASTPAASKPNPAADSAARAHFLTCTDSVKKAMEKTAEGRKKLAVEPPSGMIRPEFLAACGKPPATAVAEASKASASPAGTTPAPAQTAALTPKQIAVLKADSARKAKEEAKADSIAKHTTMARADSAKKAVADSTRADSLKKLRENEVLRETFSYTGSARDPFQSLLASAKVGPEIGDLLLVGIYQDLRYASNSVAVLRDKGSGRRYKLRVGDQLGRLKVAQIRERDVVFTVEDFGYERQETLSLKKREVESQ